MSVITRARLLLLLLLLTSSSQASIPASTIDSDAAKINSLNEALKSNSPIVFYRSQSLTCEMINECCPFIKSRLDEYTNAFADAGNALISACIGNVPPSSLLDTCPTLLKFVTIAQDEDFLKYVDVFTTTMSKMQGSDIRIPQMCSSDEAYAILCDWTKRHETESCERKRLAYVAQHRSDDDYRTFVRESKKNLRLLINAISRAFPMENATKTMTSGTTMGIKTNLWLSSSSTIQMANASTSFAQGTVWIFIILLAPLLSVFSC